MIIDKGQKMTVNAPDGRVIVLRLEVNPKAKRLILRLDERKGEAVAVAPNKKLLPQAAAFAAERAGWIANRLSAVPDPVPFEPGNMVPIRGKMTELSLDGPGRLAKLTQRPKPLLRAPGMPETFSGRITRFLKKQAQEDLRTSVDRHCATLGVRAAKISVKDTRSRWGSCTADGRLSFSWRLVCAPPDVLDYVAAHECSHLLEMNHSDRFWAHVERCKPDWKSYRGWLRTHGAKLHALGVVAASASAAAVAEASAAR